MDSALAKSLEQLDQHDLPITIANAGVEDAPLTHANDAFCALTGYTRDEIIGRNCRFLQGTMTDRDEVSRLRQALEQRTPIKSMLTNYRKDGSMFHNLLVMGQLDKKAGRDIIVGCQYEFELTSENLEIFAQLNNAGMTVAALSADSQASWSNFIDNVTMRSEAARHLLRSYVTRARLYSLQN